MTRAPRWDVERAKQLAAEGSTLPAAADELGVPKGTISSYLAVRGLKWSTFGDDVDDTDADDGDGDSRDELLEALRENKRLRAIIDAFEGEAE